MGNFSQKIYKKSISILSKNNNNNDHVTNNNNKNNNGHKFVDMAKYQIFSARCYMKELEEEKVYIAFQNALKYYNKACKLSGGVKLSLYCGMFYSLRLNKNMYEKEDDSRHINEKE